MRRILLLMVGICLGGMVFVLLCGNAAAQYAAMQAPSVPTSIELPCRVEGTSLRILETAAYDGTYLEDGGDKEVVGVAALLIENTGDHMIRAGEVTLELDGVPQRYCFSMLPPGGKVLVLERNAATYRRGTVTACQGSAEETQGRSGDITARITQSGALEVTNPSTAYAQQVTVYYKSYYSPEDMYLGGITYEASIDTLAPGQTVTLTPYHMAYGYTKVVYIEKA